MPSVSVDYDTSKAVLVTGGSGFVAGWIIKGLLDKGFNVHATVRDIANTAKSAHLTKMAAQSPGSLKLFQADLINTGSFHDAMQGCGVVFHTASPFKVMVADPVKDMIEPAVEGTRNVLEEANRTGSVQRVVLTSSTSAMYTTNEDMKIIPGGIVTEEIWNTTSSQDEHPYSYSKMLAEKTAWDMAEAQNRWSLVVINPALILGPGTARSQTSDSFNFLKLLGSGAFKRGAPEMDFGAVDVRDVAEAHLRAAFNPEASGRHIIYAKVHNFDWMARLIRNHFEGDWPLPPDDGRADRPTEWKADNSKSLRELGMEYRPVDEAVIEMFQQLVDGGAFASV